MKQAATALVALVIGASAGLIGSCASDGPSRSNRSAVPARVAAAKDVPAVADHKPRDYPGLHNIVAYHDGYYSGSAPEGAVGFDALAALGVKTIISVDGAEPELAEAQARGMRYIHLPIGYNGFDDYRKLQLVRATRDAMKHGPVYVHCHHGKHRSAGAAGAVAASLGWLTPDAATARMKVSGTAASYQGLYACATRATLLDRQVIDAVPANFPEVARPPGFVKGMVEIDEIHEHLKAIERAGWATPTDHPDLVPSAEVRRLAGLLRALAKGERAKSYPADFAKQLIVCEARAERLEELLVLRLGDGDRMSAALAWIDASCKDCHAQYRDTAAP